MSENEKEIYDYKLEDHTNFEAERSINGGSYAYSEWFDIADGIAINGEHWTSSEFPYCSHCGNFEQQMGEHLEWCFGYSPSRLIQDVAVRIWARGFEHTRDWLVEHYGEDMQLLRYSAETEQYEQG